MKTNFTEQEIGYIRSIISQYTTISVSLNEYVKQAEEIQSKVDDLKNTAVELKKKEDDFLMELHNKYGDFTLNDIYDALQ